MGLSYNEDNAVAQDDIIAQYSYDQYMNSSNLVGRTQQIQTQYWAHDFDFNSISAAETISYTLTEDVIITSILMSLSGTSVAAQDAEIHFCKDTTANKLLTIRITYANNGQSNISPVIPIPNWEFKKGEVIIALGDRSGGNNYGAISVIGYKK